MILYEVLIRVKYTLPSFYERPLIFYLIQALKNENQLRFDLKCILQGLILQPAPI